MENSCTEVTSVMMMLPVMVNFPMITEITYDTSYLVP